MEIKIDTDSLDTGDILLFKGTGWISRIVEYFGVSRYSHVGIVLKNPKFLNEELEDGIYILESSFNDTPDSEDHLYKLGVQIHRLEDVLKEYSPGCVFVRHIHTERNDDFYKKLSDIHKEIHNKPYDLDINDWLLAKLNLTIPLPPEKELKKTNTFWCSALVCYIYNEMGWIQKDINWTIIAPREFSSNEGKIICFKCEIDCEKQIY
jgi:hypothetical protein